MSKQEPDKLPKEFEGYEVIKLRWNQNCRYPDCRRSCNSKYVFCYDHYRKLGKWHKAAITKTFYGLGAVDGIERKKLIQHCINYLTQSN